MDVTWLVDEYLGNGKVKRLEQKRYEMKVKASRSAPICWLVKYEYHV